MRKKKIASIAFLTVTLVLTLYFSNASVYYWVEPCEIEIIDNQWYSVLYNGSRVPGSAVQLHLDNGGLLSGKFIVIVTLKNAVFSEKPFEAAQILNEQQLRIPYILNGLEGTETIVNFSVDTATLSRLEPYDKDNWFEVSVSFESDQWFIRSTEKNWAGQNTFRYYEAQKDTWVAAMIC